MTSPTFDFSYWPMLGIYVPRRIEAEEMPDFFHEWERISLERGRHVASFDMRDFEPLSAFGPIRHAAAREVSLGMSAYSGRLLGAVRLIGHPLTRAFLTAFDWLVPLPWPTLNTESARVGEKWLRERASDVELELPSDFELDSLRRRARGADVGLAS